MVDFGSPMFAISDAISGSHQCLWKVWAVAVGPADLLVHTFSQRDQFQCCHQCLWEVWGMEPQIWWANCIVVSMFLFEDSWPHGFLKKVQVYYLWFLSKSERLPTFQGPIHWFCWKQCLQQQFSPISSVSIPLSVLVKRPENGSTPWTSLRPPTSWSSCWSSDFVWSFEDHFRTPYVVLWNDICITFYLMIK